MLFSFVQLFDLCGKLRREDCNDCHSFVVRFTSFMSSLA